MIIIMNMIIIMINIIIKGLKERDSRRECENSSSGGRSNTCATAYSGNGAYRRCVCLNYFYCILYQYCTDPAYTLH